jgi:prephenate dehydratase
VNNVAIQGEIGSFHHIASMSYFGNDVSIVPCNSFKDVFTALDEGLANRAVVAIENSLYGSINEVYDLLLANKYYIIAEIPERIHQCLIGFDNVNLSEVTHVYSHPVALSQCANFLEDYLPTAKKIESFDTSASVKFIKDYGDIKRVAIASGLSAKMYDMPIIKSNIQNHQTNYTRFLVLAKQAQNNNTNKASLVITTNHQPGALFEVLKVFNDNEINLTKLQSRPIVGKLWRYMFYIDIEADFELTAKCLAQIKNLGCKVRNLGNYKSESQISDI